jgi:hypothetical protein
LAVAVSAVPAQDTGIKGKKVYECPYMAAPPRGVSAWAQSEMVKTGKGKESRFVPYNSNAAQGIWLDATASRYITEAVKAEGRETSFWMAYDENGWYTYMQCNEPDLQTFIDTGKDVSLEIFFVPGMNNAPYYQMIVRQLAKKVNYYDWGMAHRYYRSLEGRITVESLPVEGGVATFMFIPWDCLYDRLPLNGDYWRFSFMRWGGASLTWGGKVHDTGNFGLVHFQKPSPEVVAAIEKKILRAGWYSFVRTAAKETAHWSDAQVGDIAFYNAVLKPEIDAQSDFGKALGDPAKWDAAILEKAKPRLGDWMEFKYKVSELRSAYLFNKVYAEK